MSNKASQCRPSSPAGMSTEGLLAELARSSRSGDEQPRAEDPLEPALSSLMQECGGLRGLLRLGPADWRSRTPFSARQYRQLQLARELGRRYLTESLARKHSLTRPDQVRQLLVARLGDRRREVFAALFLDNRHRLIRFEELFQGSIDGAPVYPRVVAERALLLGAAAVIVAHNHPSGVAEPSAADQAITGRLSRALALLDIRLLDHLVVGDVQITSLAERGLMGD